LLAFVIWQPSPDCLSSQEAIRDGKDLNLIKQQQQQLLAFLLAAAFGSKHCESYMSMIDFQ